MTIDTPFAHLRRSPFEMWLRRYFLLIFLGAALTLVGYEAVFVPFFDSLFVSGVLLFLVGVAIATDLPERMRRTLTKLADRGALTLPAEQEDDFDAAFVTFTQRYARRTSFGIALLLFFVFLSVDGYYFRLGIQYHDYLYIIEFIPFIAFEVILAAIVGNYIGRATAFGRLSFFLRRYHASISVQLGHLDGAAGLKPIGDFYFFQATLLAIPALYLAVWWFLITLVPVFNDYYAQWRAPYLILLGVVLVMEGLAFFLPMVQFHQLMLEKKAVLLREADQLSAHIVEKQALLAAMPADERYDTLRNQIDFMISRYRTIQQMPTWPVDAQTWRRFGVNNLGLLLPFLGEFVSAGDVVQWLRHLVG